MARQRQKASAVAAGAAARRMRSAEVLRGRQRNLTAARAVASAALAVVAQVAVDMPEGYFGRTDEMTLWGASFASGVVFLTALVVRDLLRGRRGRAELGLPVLFSLNVGLFLPALVSDPFLAAIPVVWNLVQLALFFLPSLPSVPAMMEDAEEGWLFRTGPAVRHLAVFALVLTVALGGYRLTGQPIALAVAVLLGWGSVALAWPLLGPALAARAPVAWLIVLLLAGSLPALLRVPLALALLALVQAALVGFLLSRGRTSREVASLVFDHPSRLLFVSFASVIALGTLLLTFPAASATGRPLSLVDALFTATSATCVTGLIVVDTATAFSPFGQAVVLALIQVGGLGIMVLSTFATLILGGSLGLRGERAMTEMLESRAHGSAYLLTRFIVLGTLAVEGVGALALTLSFLAQGFGWREAAWRGVFHSVSAFCNAGFALQTDSLVIFQGSPWTLAVFAGLIVAGGLGFVVLAGLWTSLQRPKEVRLQIQARVVLLVTALLTGVGWLAYGLLEWSRSLEGQPVFDRIANAFFQSVTLRTAGFNSVGFEELAPATMLLMMLLMFIGASPGSTGGGIKTTTAAVLLAAIVSLGRGRPHVDLFRRELPRDLIYRSLAVVVLTFLVVCGSLFLLLLFEGQLLESLGFEALAFEAVSAAATVGLSLGVTPALGEVGKLIIIGTMFIGRIGPLTAVLVLGTSSRRSLYRYPPGRMMVG